MELPFFANALFWASGDSLGLKHVASPCKQISFAAEVQKKPKRCTALKVAKGPYILIQIISQFEMFFLQNLCQIYTPCRHQSLKNCNGNIFPCNGM